MTNTELRDIPPDWPTTITITIHWDDKHRAWQGHYLPPKATHFNDYVIVVVNFRPHHYPRQGDLWEVEPIEMAPKRPVAFARPSWRAS